MTTNEAAARLRTQHGHRMVSRPGPVASEYLADVVDEALAAAKAEGAQEAVERIREAAEASPWVSPIALGALGKLLDEEAAR
jgi:hypothetical protein